MANVGYATLSVIPSFRGFQSNLERGMAGPMVAAGAKAGTQAGATASQGFASKFQSGIAGFGPKLFAGLGVAAVGKQVVGLQASFESSMNTLAEAADVPAAQMQQLSEYAKEMGAQTIFSAGESADAMVELAKAGLKPAQIEAGALKATMAVAATEGLALADSARIISNAMTTFRVKGGQASEVADALAGGSKASTASVASLSEALGQVGGSARDAHLTLQETVAVLSAFDQEGIKGSDAGTSLKTMLARLVPQSKEARGAMDALGLSFTDATGSFLSIAEIAGQLQSKLGGLSDAERTAALNTIFGSDARRAAIALMSQGEEGIAKFTEATSDMGAAQRLADARMKGTAGAIERMSGAVETAGLALGEFFAPAVVTAADSAAFLADTAGSAVKAFSDLPTPVKASAAAFVALRLASATGFTSTVLSGVQRLRGGMDDLRIRTLFAADAFRTARSGVLEFTGNTGRYIAPVGRFSAALQGLSAAASGAGGALRRGLSGAMSLVGGPWGAALIGGTAILTKFWTEHQEAKQKVDELAASLDKQTGALTTNSREWAVRALTDSGALEAARELGINLETVTDAVLDEAGAMDTLSDAIRSAREAGQGGLATDLIGEVYELRGVVEEGSAEWQLMADAMGDVEAAAGGAGAALADGATETRNARDAAADYATQLKAAKDRLEDLIDKEQERRESALQNRRDQLGLLTALQDTREELNEGKKTLNENTQAGQDNLTAIYDLADQWNRSGDAVRNQKGAYRDFRKQFVELATAMGGGTDSAAARAKELADEILNLPDRKALKITTPGMDEALADIRLLAKLAAPGGIAFETKLRGDSYAGRLNGGPVSAGVPYIVGERRPEVFVPDRPGRIEPRVSGGNTFNVTVVADDPWAMKRELEHMERSGAMGGADFR